MNRGMCLRLSVAVSFALIIVLSVVRLWSSASADSVAITNPLWVSATVTSNWDHPDYAPTPYAERAIDEVTGGGGATEGESVYLVAENIDPNGNYVYYEVLNYGTSCTGVSLKFYRHPPGGGAGTYVLLGIANYVHIEDYSTGGSLRHSHK